MSVKTFVLLALVLVFLSCNSALALQANFTNHTNSVNRALNSLINFTIGAMDENITSIQINITGTTTSDPNVFALDSNWTTASNSVFSNSTYISGGSGLTLTLLFSNSTAAGIIPNNTLRVFTFNVTAKSNTASFFTIQILATGISGTRNLSSSYSWPVLFSFSGFVKNETGDFQNATNVSIYDFTQGANGPPTETIISSTLTDNNGAFTLTGLDGRGGKSYVLKIIYYNSSGLATKIATSLPPFPAEMYYPPSFEGGFEFMKPPSLNGTTFYLGPAATLNISANNGSLSQLFGYMVMDQKTGLPVASNALGNSSSVQVIVPINKRYTVMITRFNSQFAQQPYCDGNFMNNTACNAPPRSNSTIAPSSAGEIINIGMNLRVSRLNLFGCISASGNSTDIKNITSILPKMLPWEGFVPPMQPDTENINLSNTAQLNYSDSRCSGKIAWYNISLLNSNYLVEFFGRNSSAESGAEHVGAFQNISLSSATQINITLRPLAGRFVAEGTVNTTKLKINIQNSTGGQVTQDRPHIDLFIREPNTFGELTYIIEELSNGTFYISLPSSASAKAKIFSNNAPPKEKTLNLSQSEINITLISMTGGDGGFRRVNSSGDLEMMNITNSNFAVQMRFLKAGSSTCDVLASPTSCALTSTNATSFNPMSALVAGQINMEMKLTSTNTAITFYNFDMFSAKQPPMESVMNTEASRGSSANPVWEFGSFVPSDVYDYAIIAMPYSDSNIDDSTNVNISITELYDENWNAVWNSTRGDTSANFTNNIDEYLGNSNNRSYNSTGYRNFLVPGGINCTKTDNNLTGTSPTSYCFVNTSSNIIYMRVPHFSGVAPLVSGTAPSGGSTDSSSGSGGGGGGGGAVSGQSIWTNTYVDDNEDFTIMGSLTRDLAALHRTRLKINGETHHVGVKSLTGISATVEVSSEPQEATLNIDETKKFEISGDNYYDLTVKLNSISNEKASISINYIQEEIIEGPQSSPDLQEETVTGEAVEGTDGSPKSYGKVFLIVFIALIVVGIIIIFSYFLIKRRRVGH